MIFNVTLREITSFNSVFSIKFLKNRNVKSRHFFDKSWTLNFLTSNANCSITANEGVGAEKDGSFGPWLNGRRRWQRGGKI